MDEPFSHLDAITARGLRTELQQLWEATGATVLFVTHDVNEAVQLSDRILMMNRGGTLYADIPVALPRPRLQTDRDGRHQAGRRPCPLRAHASRTRRPDFVTPSRS